MQMNKHDYFVQVTWTGNAGNGTENYRTFGRAHEISSPGTKKPLIAGSSDPAFRGDPDRWNPEELLVAAVSACHKLWYLHLCSVEGLVVTDYVDRAEGTMVEESDGRGHFAKIVLRPMVTFREDAAIEKAVRLHDKAHEMCFIANSVNFPVEIEPSAVTGESTSELGLEHEEPSSDVRQGSK